MVALLSAKPYTGFAKPPVGSAVASSSPLAGGLRYLLGVAVGGGDYLYPSISGGARLLQAGASSSWTSTPYGLWISTNGSTQAYSGTQVIDALAPRFPMTVVALAQASSISNATGTTVFGYGRGGNNGWSLGLTNQVLHFVKNQIVDLGSGSNHITNTTDSYLIAAVVTTTNVRFYSQNLHDGTVVTANVANSQAFSVNAATGETVLGAGTTSAGALVKFWSGSAGFAAKWDRALTDAELRSVAGSPWQMYEVMPLQRWFVAGAAAGGTTYNQTVSATQAQALSLQKQVNVIRPLTQAQAATLAKQANLIRSATQAQSASLTALKVLIRIVTATQTQAATLIKSVQLARSASQPQTLALGKTALVTRALTQAQAVTLQKRPSLTRSASQAQTVSISALKVLIRVVSATQAQVVSLVKTVTLARSATQPQVVTLSKLATLTRLLSQAQAATVNWIKILAGAGTPGRHTVSDQASAVHTVSDTPL